MAEPQTPLFLSSPARLRQWLRKNHGRETGVWLLIAKKGIRPGVTYGEALEEALCWGWIDSRLHTHDSRYYSLWFSPRRLKSIWSLSNRRTVERLIAEGRMQQPGLLRVAQAKSSGRWKAAYSSVSVPRMPADVRRALQETGSMETFRGLSASKRLQLLHWIAQAKTPQTRARRITGLPGLVAKPGPP